MAGRQLVSPLSPARRLPLPHLQPAAGPQRPTSAEHFVTRRMPVSRWRPPWPGPTGDRHQGSTPWVVISLPVRPSLSYLEVLNTSADSKFRSSSRSEDSSDSDKIGRQFEPSNGSGFSRCADDFRMLWDYRNSSRSDTKYARASKFFRFIRLHSSFRNSRI